MGQAFSIVVGKSIMHLLVHECMFAIGVETVAKIKLKLNLARNHVFTQGASLALFGSAASLPWPGDAPKYFWSSVQPKPNVSVKNAQDKTCKLVSYVALKNLATLIFQYFYLLCENNFNLLLFLFVVLFLLFWENAMLSGNAMPSGKRQCLLFILEKFNALLSLLNKKVCNTPFLVREFFFALLLNCCSRKRNFVPLHVVGVYLLKEILTNLRGKNF